MASQNFIITSNNNVKKSQNLIARLQISQDVLLVSIALAILAVLGLVFVVIEQWKDKPFVALLWSFACFAIGALIGFLFGIPKVLQGDFNARDANASTAVVKKSGAVEYNLRVNTNLEQISDWLTKIFVGLGLVQLQRVPEHLNRASEFIAFGLGSGTKFFAAALIVYFLILGFLGFYLLTRLYLAGALGRADRIAISQTDIEEVERIEIPLEVHRRTLSSEATQAAKKIASVPFEQLSTPEDIAIWAKAQLSLGNYEEAIKGYSKLMSHLPHDVKLHIEYATALFYNNERSKAWEQLLQAYKRITPSIDKDLKKNIYRGLTFQSLYRTPPDSFEDAIKYGEEYVRDGQNIPNGAIWTNLAAAYGQKTSWLLTHTLDPEILKETRSHALHAINQALDFGGRWKSRLRELLQHDYHGKDPEENDLEVFEDDEEFRKLLGLPPLRRR
jgi:tetratricopeptide (TPR) repeat protein